MNLYKRRIVVGGAILFGLLLGSYAHAQPGAQQIVAGYKKASDWTQSAVMTVTTTIETSRLSKTDGTMKTDHFEYVVEAGCDGERVNRMGKILRLDDTGRVIPELSTDFQQLLDGKQFVDTHKGLDKSESANYAAAIGRETETVRSDILRDPSLGSFLDGRPLGLDGTALGLRTYESVADALLGDPELIREENIDGVMCYVIRAKGDYGELVAWIAPDKGYNALRYEVHKVKGGGPKDKPILDDSLKEWSFVVEGIEVSKIGDTFVSTAGEATITDTFENGDVITTHTTALRTGVNLAPDFEAMNFFKIRLPNGNPVYSVDLGGVVYQCLNGELVPFVDDSVVDAIDEVVDEKKDQSVGGEPAVAQNVASGTLPRGVGETIEGQEVSQDSVRTEVDESESSKAWVWVVSAAVGLTAVMLAIVHKRRKSSA